MNKRLALLFCILLLPTIAASASQEGNRNYGDFWVGGQVGALFTSETSTDVTVPGLGLSSTFNSGTDSPFNLGTKVGVTAGAIVGYNFCMPYRQPWERYFGVALDFSWNQYNQKQPFGNGNQFALSLLGRLQYPFMRDERFTRGRLVPFIMFGPAVVWTKSGFPDFGGAKTSTDFGIVAEIGAEFFIIPNLSIGPSFRYRHVFGQGFDFQGITIDEDGLNQFTLMARVAYHF